jgi:apoptosis-inducing factor 2
MMNASQDRATVVVIGGGYAGIAAAKGLDEHADVQLVETKEAFQHNVAALRAVADPAWLDRIFLPYDRLLTHGRVIHDRAVRVDAGSVRLASDAQLHPDFLVLATGSTYPFPAKSGHSRTGDAIADYHAVHANLAKATRVLLVGAGAVGLEFAGEIAAAWPGIGITLVDLADRILPGPMGAPVRDELNRQLDDLGVRRILGAPLTSLPDTPPGQIAAFTVTTAAGERIDADIWFACHGDAPVTDYLDGTLAQARTPDGYLQVNSLFQVTGQDRIYAIGDIAATDINRAGYASRHADLAVRAIQAQITGGPLPDGYQPNPPSITVPLGPAGGAGQSPTGELTTAEYVARVKGRDMMIDRFRQLLNLA